MNYQTTVDSVMSLLKEKKVCSSSRRSHKDGYDSLEEFLNQTGRDYSEKAREHHFPPIDIDLDEKGKPCLQFHMHKAEIFIKEIEIIIFAFAVHSVEGEQPIVMLFRLKCLAVFHNGEDADEPLIYRLFLKNL